MNKKASTPKKAKPKRTAPTPNQPSWPTQGHNAGIKNARSIHDRKPISRGASRGG